MGISSPTAISGLKHGLSISSPAPDGARPEVITFPSPRVGPKPALDTDADIAKAESKTCDSPLYGMLFLVLEYENIVLISKQTEARCPDS